MKEQSSSKEGLLNNDGGKGNAARRRALLSDGDGANTTLREDDVADAAAARLGQGGWEFPTPSFKYPFEGMYSPYGDIFKTMKCDYRIIKVRRMSFGWSQKP